MGVGRLDENWRLVPHLVLVSLSSFHLSSWSSVERVGALVGGQTRLRHSWADSCQEDQIDRVGEAQGLAGRWALGLKPNWQIVRRLFETWWSNNCLLESDLLSEHKIIPWVEDQTRSTITSTRSGTLSKMSFYPILTILRLLGIANSVKSGY